MKTLDLALLGFGNAARAFARILLEKEEALEMAYCTRVRVTTIATGSRGTMTDPQGLDLGEMLRQIEEDGCFDRTAPQYRSWNALETVKQADYDAAIELTPLNIFTGQPAISHLETAMNRGKHVITANKGPIAWDFHRLRSLAESRSVQFFYETTVMDGTPVFNLVADTLKYCRVLAVDGILNTTTNFVLEELSKGVPYEDVLAEGRRRGFVEADPAMDLEGWDAAAKLTALLNVLMDARLTPQDIHRTGITAITGDEVAAAASRGNVIKLLCHGDVENGQVQAWVRPTEIPREGLYAAIDGTSSVVSITTDLMGKLSVVEHNPELPQTGYGVFSDLVRLLDAVGKA